MRTEDEIADDLMATLLQLRERDLIDTARLMNIVFRLDHLRAEMTLAQQCRREE